MTLRKQLLDVQLDRSISSSPIMVVKHKGDIDGEIRMFLNYAENPPKLQVNSRSEYKQDKFKEIVEEEYDKKDYYEILYGVNMEIDEELGMYYVKKEVDDPNSVLADECEECGQEFSEDDRVFMDDKYGKRHKEYCETCKRKLEVAHEL